MSNAIYPTLPGLAWSVVRRPVWKTIRHESTSGMEVAATLTAYPRYKITLTYEFLRSGAGFLELEALLGFFNQRRGAWDTFLWLDPVDYQTTGYQLGTGDGASTGFVLARNFGGFVEPVTDLLGTPQVWVSGVPKTLGADFNVSGGRLVFNTPPPAGAPVTWSGSYYRRVRFDEDEIELDEFMSRFHSVKTVPLITVKS